MVLINIKLSSIYSEYIADTESFKNHFFLSVYVCTSLRTKDVFTKFTTSIFQFLL